MNYFSQNKFYQTGFYLLLLLNVLIIVWVLVLDRRPPHHRRGGHEPGRQGAGMMAYRLQLDERQSAQFELLFETHAENVRQKRELIRKKKQALFETVAEGNQLHAEALSKDIGRLETQVHLMLYEHLSELKQLLNEEQLLLMDELMNEGMHPGARGRRGH